MFLLGPEMYPDSFLLGPDMFPRFDSVRQRLTVLKRVPCAQAVCEMFGVKHLDRRFHGYLRGRVWYEHDL